MVNCAKVIDHKDLTGNRKLQIKIWVNQLMWYLIQYPLMPSSITLNLAGCRIEALSSNRQRLNFNVIELPYAKLCLGYVWLSLPKPT